MIRSTLGPASQFSLTFDPEKGMGDPFRADASSQMMDTTDDGSMGGGGSGSMGGPSASLGSSQISYVRPVFAPGSMMPPPPSVAAQIAATRPLGDSTSNAAGGGNAAPARSRLSFHQPLRFKKATTSIKNTIEIARFHTARLRQEKERQKKLKVLR